MTWLYGVIGLGIWAALAWAISRLDWKRPLKLLVSATLFGGAMFTAHRLGPVRSGTSQDDWWRQDMGKALVIWSLVEAPSLLGLVAYILTRDFRTLIATFIGLLFFGSYRPSRLIER